MFQLKKTDNDNLQEITISTRTFVKIGLLVVLTYAFILIVHRAYHSLVLLFMALFLSLALNAPVHSLAKKLPGRFNRNRTISAILCILVVLILLGGFASYVAPPLVRQTNNFINQAPQLITEFRNQNSPIGSVIRRYHLQGQIDTFAKQLSSREHNIGGTAFSAVTKIGKSVFAVLTVLVLTFMMLVEGEKWVKFAKSIIPDKKHNLANRMADDMYKVIKGYVNGQVLLALIASLLILPGLLILHISYPVALMVIVFTCGLIPMVGHTLGAIILGIVGSFHSLTAGLAILIYYLLYQQFENYIIQPKIQSNTTNMSPLLVFASLVVGINFGGLLGGLIAIPLAGCLRIIIIEYLRTNNYISEKQFEESTNLVDN